MDKRIELFNILHEDIYKSSLIESILNYCSIRFSKSPHDLNDHILEKLKTYLDSLSELDEIYEIQNLFFDCDSVSQIRELAINKTDLLKEELEILTAYDHQEMLTETLLYLKVRFSNSPISINKELIEQVEVYLKNLSAGELGNTKNAFFRCTNDEELYNLITNKLGS